MGITAGTRIYARAEFRSAATPENPVPTLVTPTAVVLKVRDPTGTITTPAPTAVSTGVYTAVFTVATAGEWSWQWTATGTVEVTEKPVTIKVGAGL
jgi:hypothetical protein